MPRHRLWNYLANPRNGATMRIMRRKRLTPRTAKNCPECEVVFMANATQKYCSEKCSSIATRRRLGKYPDRRTGECGTCGTPFVTGKSWQRFCSRECATRNYNSRWRNQNATDLKLSTASIGTISELLVVIDLLSLGYDVFKSVSPACPCDLAVVKNGKLYRVEVTTAYYGPTGKRMGTRKDDYTKYEIVAYVLKASGQIEYEPPLPDA